MKNALLLCLFSLLSAVPAIAQSGPRYQYDNFDIEGGIHIQQPPPAATPKKRGRPSKTAARSFVRPAALVSPQVSPIGMNPSKSLDGFTTGDSGTDSLIAGAGARNGVDPVLIYALMHQESTFKPRAVSPKGARGLMQLMPGTAARFGVRNIFDPAQNIEGGTRYLRFLLDLFNGDIALALAGYNAGEGAVMKYGQIPPYRETQEYVRRISRRYSLMRDPETALNARRFTPVQVAAARSEQPVPLTVYERSVFAVRLPDGRLQLLSQ